MREAINQRYGRAGHLFRNRFFSKTIESDAHQVASIAYVNRNPVHHCACEDAADWRDSSYRATMGLERAPAWLRVDEVLGRLRHSQGERSSCARLARLLGASPGVGHGH